MLLSHRWSLKETEGCGTPSFEASLSLLFHNAQPLESQSGKFALAPAGLGDERALG